MDMFVTLTAVFLFVGLLSVWGLSAVMLRQPTGRDRLRQMSTAAGPEIGGMPLAVNVDSRLLRFPGVPKSAKEMNRLRLRLARAGYPDASAVAVYALANLALPLLFGSIVLLLANSQMGRLAALGAAAAGYLLPGIFVARRIQARTREIENGIADALDLLIVCVEAGSGLDQAIVKASDELGLAYPALAAELRTVTTEIRAGRPRLEAYRNFAVRTNADEVRALVTLLTQTDKFGTSIAQALRTHAQTSRTNRRQRAEERAAKVGVKLVFPLVFLLFPALYVVILGPAVIQFLRVFRPDVP